MVDNVSKLIGNGTVAQLAEMNRARQALNGIEPELADQHVFSGGLKEEQGGFSGQWIANHA
jgi:hypothetical protein